MAAEDRGLYQEIAALKESMAGLREGQEHIVSQLELTGSDLREDIREGSHARVAIQNGQFAFATATVAGLLGVIATLILKL
jgi:hypothetical protein